MKAETARLIQEAARELRAGFELYADFRDRETAPPTTALGYNRENDLLAACALAMLAMPAAGGAIAAYVTELRGLRRDSLGILKLVY